MDRDERVTVEIGEHLLRSLQPYIQKEHHRNCFIPNFGFSFSAISKLRVDVVRHL
jgi:hypothetical protein